jgi:iron complex transport system substrate-binding protein
MALERVVPSSLRSLVLGVFAAGALACGGGSADSSPTAATSTPSASNHEPRLVVMAPVAAEILDALGASNRVVGVGDFVGWPPALAALPKVGAYDRPNAERILELHGELFVTTRGQAGAGARAELEHLGVEVLELETATMAGVLDAIAVLGSRTGRSEAAATLAGTVRAGVEAVRARSAPLTKRRVLVVVGREPLYVAGPGSYLDELIAVAGGTNVVADTAAPFQALSVEAALERLPEVIVDTSDNRPETPRGRVAGDWARWPFLPAVADRRVWVVAPAVFSIPGPRLPAMADLLARCVHPEVFGEPSPAALAGTTTPNAR